MWVSGRVQCMLVALVWLAAVFPIGSSYAGLHAAGAPTAALDSGWNVDLVGHIGGGALVVQAPYAYQGFDKALAILDLSNPARPIRIGYVLLPRPAAEIAVVGRYVYVFHDDANISLIDISEPHQPILISTSASLNGLSVGDIALSGNYAYITWQTCHYMIGCYGGLQIVDISNPTHPTLEGEYTQSGQVGYVVVVGTLAYLLSRDKLQILNVSNPSAVQVVSTYMLPTNATDIVVAGAYAYIALVNCEPACDAGSLAIVDVSNPATPRTVGSVVTPGGPQSIALSGSFVYVTMMSDCAIDCRGGLAVIEIARPTAPRVVGRLNIDSPFNYDPAVAGTNVLIMGLYGLYVVDVAKPRTPRQIGFYGVPEGSRDVEVAGDYAYVLGAERLHIVNIADPSAPYETGFYKVPGGTGDLDVAGRYAYVTWSSSCEPDCHSGLRIVDISNPAAPRQVGAYDPSTGVYNVTVAGGYAYVTYTAYTFECSSDCPSTLTVVDVATPSTPRAVGVYTVPHTIKSVAVVGTNVYVSTMAGLRIVDVSLPTAPREIAVYAASEWLGAVAVSGDYTYVYRNAGVQILDLSNPAVPHELGFYAFGSDVDLSAVDVAGRYAYVHDWQRLHIVDVSNPKVPRVVGTYDFRIADNITEVTNIAVVDKSIYVARGSLSILKFTGPPTIAGRVVDIHDRPFADVKVTASDGQIVTTNTTGAYSLTNVFSGTYQLAPALAGYAFDPPMRTVMLPPNPGRQDFTILPGPVSTSLTPGAAASLTYTDTQGLATRLDIPSGAVTQTATLALTPTLAARAGGMVFAGHAFDLAVIEQGVDRSDFTFGAPVIVMIRYSDLDVRTVSDEQRLTLRRWTGSGWEDATKTCANPKAILRDIASNVMSLAICQPGRFGLFGPTHPMFLPHIGVR